MKKLKFLSITLGILLLFAGFAVADGQWSPLFIKAVPGGIFGVLDTSQTTGDIWYVDSGMTVTGGDTAGHGRNPISPCLTLDYCAAMATANNGDIIYVAAGHAETIAAADGFDITIAGLRIVGLGEGADKPTYTFTETVSTVAIGAANVTIENFRFLAGIEDVVIGLAVEAAGDNFTCIDCEWPEPTTSTFEFVDAVDLESGADGVKFIRPVQFTADETDADHWMDAGNGVNNNLQIIDAYLYGEYAVSAIWSETLDLEVLIEGGTITNLTNGQHAIEFVTAAALGTIKDILVRTNAQGTSVDPGSLTMSNVLWDDDTTADTVAIPVVLAAAGAGSIGGIDDTNTDSLQGKIGTDAEMGDTSMYDQWIEDQIDLDAILASIPSGMSYVGTVTGVTGTTITTVDALKGYGTNYFKNGWTLIVIWDFSGTNIAPEQEIQDISAYNTTTGAFTHGATTQIAEGDVIMVVRDELISMYQKALPTIPVTDSLAFKISKWLADGDGDFATGTPLASDKSLVDALGQTGGDTNVVPDRNAAVIQERIDAITTVMQMVDPSGTNGWEDDGSGGNLYTTFNSTDANAYLFSGDGGMDKDDNVFSYFAHLERMSEEILSGLRASGKSIGDVFYVSSTTGGAYDGSTWALAETTLQAGITDCTASEGCIVFVAPAHAEPITTAITANVIGISVIGLGTGSQMPTLTFTNANSSIDISVAGVTIQNLRLYNTTAATDNAISILAGGKYAVIDGIEFTDTGGSNYVHTIGILLASAADNVTIKNCSVYNVQSGATSFIDATTGIVNRLLIENNDIWGDYSDAGIDSDKALTNMIVKGNVIRNINSGSHAIQLTAAATGYAHDNILTADVPSTIFDPGSLLAFKNTIVESDVTDANTKAYLEDGDWFYTFKSFDLLGTTTTSVLFNVVGMVEVRVWGEITETFTSVGSAISVGIADEKALLIASTDGNAPVTQGDIWTGASPSKGQGAPTTYIIDTSNIVVDELTEDLDDGRFTLHVYWRPLEESGSVIVN